MDLDLLDIFEVADLSIVRLLNMQTCLLSWLNVNEVALEMTATGHGWLMDDHDCDVVFVFWLGEISEKLFQNEVLE